MYQDYRQPLVGFANFFIGLGKAVTGIFTFNFWTLADGLFSMLRGVIELATTPLAWTLKLITRLIATLIHGGPKKIEENSGLQRLAEYGLDYLQKKTEDNLTSDQTIYELLAVCNDIHRKFDKSLCKGQPTEQGVEEQMSYAEIRSDNGLNRQKLLHYFSLFAPQKETLADRITYSEEILGDGVQIK